jgi:hypothetical protein
LERFNLQAVSRNLAVAACAPRLLDAFRAESIFVIPFKGLDVALSAYGDLSLRHIGDVDLITSESDFPRAAEVLQRLEFTPASEWGWETTFSDASGRVKIDLHRSISPPQLPIKVDLRRWQARMLPLDVPGGTIPSLSIEDLLLVLCIQVAEDGRTGRCELKKICDIAELIRAHPGLAWDLAVDEAQKIGCRRILFLGLLAAEQLRDAQLPPRIGTRIRAEREMPFLFQHLTEGIWTIEDGARPSETDSRRFATKVRERWRDRVRPSWHQLLERTEPNEADSDFLQLPDRLRPLYYLIRPVRVFMSVARRGMNRQRERGSRG